MTKRKVHAIFIVIIIALVGSYFVFVDSPKANPLLLILFPNDTKYSSKYTESGFKQIKVGMTINGVEEIIGKPLYIDEYAQGSYVREKKYINGAYIVTDETTHLDLDNVEVDEYVYRYSVAGSKFDNYFYRRLVISKRGFILNKVAGYYTD